MEGYSEIAPQALTDDGCTTAGWLLIDQRNVSTVHQRIIRIMWILTPRRGIPIFLLSCRPSPRKLARGTEFISILGESKIRRVESSLLLLLAYRVCSSSNILTTYCLQAAHGVIVILRRLNISNEHIVMQASKYRAVAESLLVHSIVNHPSSFSLVHG